MTHSKRTKIILNKYLNIFRLIYNPHIKKLNVQYYLRMFYIYIKNSWVTYRHFFGYPKYNKTRNNHKSSKQLSIKFKNFLLKFVYTKHFKNYTKSDKYLVIHLEYLNKLWYFQWKEEWEQARDKFLESFWITKRKKIKFGVAFSKKFRVFNFILKKAKKNKKKISLPKDTYNIGFYFHFSKKFKKFINAGKSIKY